MKRGSSYMRTVSGYVMVMPTTSTGITSVAAVQGGGTSHPQMQKLNEAIKPFHYAAIVHIINRLFVLHNCAIMEERLFANQKWFGWKSGAKFTYSLFRLKLSCKFSVANLLNMQGTWIDLFTRFVYDTIFNQ